MQFFMPRRYLTSTDEERSLGYFALGGIADMKGDTVRRGGYSTILKGLRSGRLCFEIYVSGRCPPADELWSAFLLVTPTTYKKHLRGFESQLEIIETKAVDFDANKSHEMLLLNPRRQARCFEGTRKLNGRAAGVDLQHVHDWTSRGTPVTYVLNARAMRTDDIVLIKDTPEEKLAISDSLANALKRALPKRGHYMDFREYALSPPSSRRKVSARATKSKRTD